MDINDLALGHERIDFRVIYQDDLDAGRIETRRLDQWIADILEQQLCFAVAQD